MPSVVGSTVVFLTDQSQVSVKPGIWLAVSSRSVAVLGVAPLSLGEVVALGVGVALVEGVEALGPGPVGDEALGSGAESAGPSLPHPVTRSRLPRALASATGAPGRRPLRRECDMGQE